MTSKLDTPETIAFLAAFQKAWKLVIKDYDARLINGEHTMQASLYHHLLQKLEGKDGYSIYTEANLAFRNSKGKPKKIDLLVIRQLQGQKTPEVVAAIELKFKPRIFPGKAEIEKDLINLVLVTNRRAKADCIDIKMDRYEAKDRAMHFSISPQRKLIWATFCRADSAATKRSLNAREFWKSFKPDTGNEKQFSDLGIVFAMTSKSSKTESKFFGPVFEKTNIGVTDLART